MLKLCDQSIVKPLSIIFKNCKLRKTFPDLWKKANIVPIHKKGEKDLIKNFHSLGNINVQYKKFFIVFYSFCFVL